MNEFEVCQVQWEYEDELPEDLKGDDYDSLFQNSKIIDGVRMFPFIETYYDENSEIAGIRRIYLGSSE